MEPKDLLLCSQEPATCPHPEPDESSPHPLICSDRFLKIFVIASREMLEEYHTLK
jgi:hypothetical protein